MQVLNEFAAVATRKLGMEVREAADMLAALRRLCKVVPLDEETHDIGMACADRYRLPIYDAMIVAAARQAGCSTILSEDFQDGARVDGIRVRNPFR